MGKISKRLAVFASIAVVLLGGWAQSAHALVLDWDAVAWADGSTNNSYDLTGNVSFTIFDIDVTTNSDIIDGIFGIALDGSFVAATITNVGSAVTLTGTGLNQVLTGNAAAADNSSNGNATISFGSTIITYVFFTFSNTAGAPRFQNIGIGDVTFTPVPEMNPAMVAGASCIAARVAPTTLLVRRSRFRAPPYPRKARVTARSRRG